MNKNEALRELFNEWETRHRGLGKKQFIVDGFVDEGEWNKSELKICFLLKESYFDLEEYKKDLLMPNQNNIKHHWNNHIKDQDGMCIYNLVEHLKEHRPWFMWCRVEEWLKSIFGLWGMDSADPIHKIAIINIKKSDGEHRSNGNDILQYARDDGDLIKRELEIIDPDVVICGGTYGYCVREGLFDDLQIIDKVDKFNGRIIAKSGKRIVVDCYHPAYSISYDRMDDYFANILPYIKKSDRR